MTVLVVIFLTAVVALFSGTYGKGKFSRNIGILGLGLAFGGSFFPDSFVFQRYASMYIFGANAALFSKISILITLLIFILSDFSFGSHRSYQSELYALMLFSLCGGIILFGFQNLIIVFLGIEILSIPLYVMAGSKKTELRSIESSLKYFLIGAFVTGFLLFGIALVYGSVGSFDVYRIRTYGEINPLDRGYTMGAILILSALAFKVSLVPFHMWSPDVYQGTPSIITAFMSSVVKVAAFYTFFKLMTLCFPGIFSVWISVLSVLVIVTLLVSNIMGLVQHNVKRMLAYSSISHAGYLSITFFGMTNLSLYILAFYLFAYAISTVGIFACLTWVEKEKGDLSLKAFSGLGKTRPLLAVTAAVSLFSMAGIPITAGFIGKLGLFSQAIRTSPLVILVAVLGSAVSIAYYLKVIRAMFFSAGYTEKKAPKTSLPYTIVALFTTVTIVVMGVCPDAFAFLFNLR
ncbi:MAG: NADH-quinone oxidoreductase subunit N [Bergeyella sp.]|nr:NADH-quinone oxidoreductase subunit N [Bergeyella sp.]